jgi:hypothetical protein
MNNASGDERGRGQNTNPVATPASDQVRLLGEIRDLL